jgi:hypothetical protein
MWATHAVATSQIAAPYLHLYHAHSKKWHAHILLLAQLLGLTSPCCCASLSFLQVLGILSSSSDDRAVENELVMTLGFDHFELIKELLRNRVKLVWCIKLSRAQVGTRGGGSGGASCAVAVLQADKTQGQISNVTLLMWHASGAWLC